MSRRAALTLIDLLAIFAIFLLLFILLMPQRGGNYPSNRTFCGTRLNGLYKALNAYSVDNRELFPTVGALQPTGTAIGFAEGDRLSGSGARLDNNVTAPLWTIVRDASVSPKNFVCPSNKTAREDPLTVDGTPTGQPAPLNMTNDFFAAAHLSYSIINTHHPAYSRHWGPNTSADWVMMSYDTTHKTEGQNIMFGDGHVSFDTDPFVGPSGDNVFAMVKGGKNVPPTLSNSDGDAATDPEVAKYDVALLPITGNGGGAGSLDPSD
jgi:prepilin-type processing-associated H-X9-DG protein